MRVWINGVDTKWVKFSLPDSASNEEVIGNEEYEDTKATWDDDEVKDLKKSWAGGVVSSIKDC